MKWVALSVGAVVTIWALHWWKQQLEILNEPDRQARLRAAWSISNEDIRKGAA